MPVRKIPKSFRTVTGRFTSIKNGQKVIWYESKGEHDYFLTLEFEPNVLCYEEQPLEVPGEVNGRKVVYTPDCLVTHKFDRLPLLVEVKTEEEVENDDGTLGLKFKQVSAYAQENGYEFKVITEKDIPREILKNYLKIYQYALPPRNLQEMRGPIINLLSSYGTMTFEQLLQSIDDNNIVQARYLPIIWHLIFIRIIEVDLTQTISYQSELRLADGH